MSVSLLRNIKNSILHLFYPRLCEGCSKPLVTGEEILCLGCSQEIPETNYHLIEDNDAALRFAGRIPYIKATSYAYFTHEGLLQHLLHGLKYKDKKDIGLYLGRKFGASLKASGWAEGMDMILPVPLHKAKEANRGYNQSRLIAMGMSDYLGIPVCDDILYRVRDTASQTNKTRSERITNMKEAFMVSDRDRIKGKHILLCDDVLTTGATLEACALALMAEESTKISVATIGIAVS